MPPGAVLSGPANETFADAPAMSVSGNPAATLAAHARCARGDGEAIFW